MADNSNIDIVVRVQQITSDAFTKLAADLKKLEGQARQAGDGVGSGLGGGIAKATTGLGGLEGLVRRFAGPAVIGYAIKSTIDWADRLNNLKEATGASYQSLQLMERAAQGSGQSLEALTGVMEVLGVKIGKGDASTVAAFEKLGLHIDDLRKQDLGTSFLQVVKAADQLTNSYQRQAVQAEVFGKGSKELGGALHALAQDQADAATASDEHIVALSRLQNAFGSVKTDAKVFAVDTLGGIIDGFRSLNLWAKQATDSVTSFFRISSERGASASLLVQLLTGLNTQGLFHPGGTAGTVSPRPLGGSGALAVPGVPGDLDTVLLDLRQQTEARADATKRATKAAEALAAAEFNAATYLHAEFARRQREAALTSADVIQRAQESINLQRPGYGHGQLVLPSSPLPQIGLYGDQGPDFVGPPAPYGTPPPKVKWGSIGGDLRGLLQTQLGPTILAALTGGGNVGQSVGGLLGGGLFSGTIGKTITSGLTSGLGSTIGGALGSVVPGLGTLLGAGVGALIGKIGGLFKNQEWEEVKKLRGQFIDAAGGVDALAERARKAGTTIDALLAAKKVTTFNAAVAGLETAFQKADLAAQQLAEDTAQITDLQGQLSQLNAWQTLEAGAEKYGVALDALGPQFAKLRDDAQTTDILEFFNAATAAGGDAGAIIHGLADELSILVQDAHKNGNAIPENLRPLIQVAFDTGQLLDENGDKMTSLAELQWGDPVKTQAEIIQAAIDDLTTKIADLQKSIDGLDFSTMAEQGVAAFQAIEEAATGAAVGHSPTGVQQISVEAIRATGEIEQLGRVAYATFSTLEETAASVAHTAVASFDDLGSILQHLGQQWEDVTATPLQKQLNSIDRSLASTLASLAPYQQDPRYADAVALANAVAEIQGRTTVFADRQQQADQLKRDLADRVQQETEARDAQRRVSSVFADAGLAAPNILEPKTEVVNITWNNRVVGRMVLETSYASAKANVLA